MMGFAASLGADAMHAATANAATTQADFNFMVSTPLRYFIPNGILDLIRCGGV
jgi:hypothetical protein